MGKKGKIFIETDFFVFDTCYFPKEVYVNLEMLINEHKW